MKLTDDIVRAIHACIEDGFESVADFANFADVFWKMRLFSICLLLFVQICRVFN